MHVAQHDSLCLLNTYRREKSKGATWQHAQFGAALISSKC